MFKSNDAEQKEQFCLLLFHHLRRSEHPLSEGFEKNKIKKKEKKKKKLIYSLNLGNFLEKKKYLVD